ncbi:hypothetical protein GLAREA_00830 [Glarea lozoyensis ATCC 20868]|uniref:Uncharacterized protein n=1 Tax=Glarea lozoyensis (strain ATCC 20868 / MF5171) TaxID=1116229 RepID=S3CVI8_GLAL2|nr:uncharacterized protein GLAREA_00830 [Glarea lozoyensis ATCC 20868]EPE29670.1 hypothetical protein GLAREA_00830 [Glarea lozoyensis ATCC 20868]
MEKAVEHMAAYINEIRTLAKKWCQSIDKHAECLDDLGGKKLVPWRDLIAGSNYNKSNDSGDFNDLVQELKGHGMRRVINMMEKTRAPVTEQIMECREVVHAWRSQQEYRLLGYRFYETPEFWRRWNSGDEALEYLQNFTATVQKKIEITRMALRGLESVISDSRSRLTADMEACDYSDHNEVEEFCREVMQKEYERQTNPESLATNPPPDLEEIYANIIDKLSFTFETYFDALDGFSESFLR